MSCYDLCRPCGPTPLANSCNEPCVRQCQDSRVVIQPSPVVVTLPGPILSSFPQNTAVGSTTSAAVGSILSEEGVPINSGGFGFSGLGYGDDTGYGVSLGYGGQHGSGGFGNCGRSYSSGFSSYGTGYYLPGAQRWGRSRRGSCGAF
ncbi:unnamed protein product [Bubo scandiacus]